jgi:hypothetical protein
VPAALFAKIPSTSPAVAESAITVKEPKPARRLEISSRTASLPLASISGLSSTWPLLHPFPKQTPTPISSVPRLLPTS